MKKQITWVGILAVGLMALGACSDNSYFLRVLERTSTNVPDDITEETTNVPAGAADPSLSYFNVTNNWMQPNNTPLAKPEIVFVVDTSGSMGNEVQAIKDSIQDWTAQLESQGVFDYCLNIMRAHVPGGGRTPGELIAASGNDKCICTYGNNAVSSATAVTKFRENMDAALGTNGGGRTEAPLVSMNMALNDSSILAANRAAGCFRDDATLVMVAVSDEQMACYSPNLSGINFENEFFLGAGNEYSGDQNDPLWGGATDAAEPEVRRDYCTDGTTNANGKYENNLTVESLIDDIQQYNGDLPTYAAAIGYVPGAPGSGGQPFWGGNVLAEAFGGSIVDMQDSVNNDDAAFQASMNEMANALVQEISFYDSFTLSGNICDVDGDDAFIDEEPYVTVKVENVVVDPANWSINATGTKIIFNQSYQWSNNDTIQVEYLRCE